MKIRTIGIKGFRGYANQIQVQVSDLLVLVGKNDIGKSTILEALDIFFNDGKGAVKLDKEDINKANLTAGDDCIEISVEFDDLPAAIVIDSTNETTLADEHLLTEVGTLKIIKRYPNAGKEKVFISAYHPTAPGCSELLLKKNSDLKKLLVDLGLECQDKTRNAELRKGVNPFMAITSAAVKFLICTYFVTVGLPAIKSKTRSPVSAMRWPFQLNPVKTPIAARGIVESSEGVSVLKLKAEARSLAEVISPHADLAVTATPKTCVTPVGALHISVPPIIPRLLLAIPRPALPAF